ncbi:MAG: hypothetical protein JWL76_1414 [Thermoleophilia bacterium]|nr:hypothetical protein [Thermoleophilia bacterium]
MPTFVIEQREPGDPRHGELRWTIVGTVEAPTAPHAIYEFCIAMQYYSHELRHNTAVVHGVGWFRATLPPDEPTGPPFVIQHQDPIGPDDRHLTWSDVAQLRAPDAASALQAFLDAKGWSADASVFGTVANLAGIGSLRAVRAEDADAMRVTPAPT